jgi:GTP diphosphokinase / guanosine-3',5'-bis(diphosphate) 3'-diphosphatase
MNDDVLLLVRAYDFAARKHLMQRRKGIAAEPYVNHLTEVAGLLAEATAGADARLIAGGILHDTLEDTDATREELAAAFGADIAALVAEVTDDKSLKKAERKRLQVENAPKKSARAKMIKLADKTSNLRALAHSPPADWESARKHEYFEWAWAVVAGCRGVNAFLETVFDDAWRQGIEALRGS